MTKKKVVTPPARAKRTSRKSPSIAVAWERAALDASSVATAWVDADRRVQAVNRAARALLVERAAVFRALWPDFTPDSVEGRSLEAVVGEPLAGPRQATPTSWRRTPRRCTTRAASTWAGRWSCTTWARAGARRRRSRG